MKKFISFIFNLIFPPRCFICGKVVSGKSGLCMTCYRKIHFLTNQCCPVCGRPYTFPLENDKELICAKCLNKKPPLNRMKAVFAYDDFSKKLILPFKHSDRTDIVPFLIDLMIQSAEDYIRQADVIIPVPLHRTRLIKRKYNQAAMIAKGIAKRCHKTYLPDVLIRVKPSSSNKHLSKKDRLENVKGAFALKNKNHLTGKRVLLIDDVYTTGATLNECAKTLKKTNARDISALTLARVCWFE